MRSLAAGTAQGLRLDLQPPEGNRFLAVHALAIVGAVYALQRIADGLELAAVDVRNDAFDLVLARPLTSVVSVLQQCLPCRLNLGLALQLRRALALQAQQPTLQQVRQHRSLILGKLNYGCHPSAPKWGTW